LYLISSGDARRAIEIAKRTFEIVEADEVSAVTAVSKAFQELFSSPKITALRYACLLYFVFPEITEGLQLFSYGLCLSAVHVKFSLEIVDQ